MPDVLILGCGFTGRRVAERLLARGCRVRCTTRDSLNLEHPGALSGLRGMVTPGVRVLHSIPTLAGEMDRVAVEALEGAARVVYLSTTAVYGNAVCVDETTPAAPESDRARARVRTEQAVLDGPWAPLVLRPAAIYGPGRGIHVSMRIRDGGGVVSRIHVDDVATHAEAALLSEVTGAWPVADDHPCPSSEVAEFLANWGTGVEIPHPPVDCIPWHPGAPTARHSNRRVDGSAIRRVLGISLRYPSYLTGIPAALDEQRRACHDRDSQ